MVLKKKNPASPPACFQAPSSSHAEGSSSRIPSMPPPAYIQPGSSSRAHSSSDIALPPYEGPLFANYTPERKGPPANVNPANVSITVTSAGSVASENGDVETQRGQNANRAPAAQNFARRQAALARRPMSQLTRKQKNQRISAYFFFGVLLSWMIFWMIYWFRIAPEEASAEDPAR